MLLEEPTPEMIGEWKDTFEQYKTKLAPNKKSARDVVEYLRGKYPITEVTDEYLNRVVLDQITMNSFNADKVPPDKTLKPQVFELDNEGAGASLYSQQEEIFDHCKIIVGVEHETAYVMVEGSGLLHDELVAFQGLDAADLTNFFLVAQYISCLERFNLLDKVVRRE